MLLTEPFTGLQERFVEVTHHEVNDPTMCVTDIALVTVLGTIERERRIAVVMKRTECLVVAHGEPEG